MATLKEKAVQSGITSFRTSNSGKSINAYAKDKLVFTLNNVQIAEGQTATQWYLANRDRVLTRERALGNAMIYDMGIAVTQDSELELALAADAAELGIKPAPATTSGPRRKVAPKGKRK
jgi:hypothetical protein